MPLVVKFLTFSSSVLSGADSPVGSTCRETVARSLHSLGFCVKSSSVRSHNGKEASTRVGEEPNHHKQPLDRYHGLHLKHVTDGQAVCI